jgi:malonyl CoA-acyl carrier protein transacylase
MEVLEYKTMYIFPGQGAQYVGMGSDLYSEYAVAREVYDTASDLLGFDIAELSFKDPDNQLNQTRFTQLALLTHSIACLRVFEDLTDHQLTPFATAGHSLGEYSALVAAEALTFENALELVKKRGELMSEYGRGKMLAFPLDLKSIESSARRHYCGIGGCNLPQQTVVGGTEEDLQLVASHVAENFKRKGAFLNTGGAFHTYLMVKAAEEFRPYLESSEMQLPKSKVLSNYTGDYHADDPAEIKASLFFQLFNPIKWIWGMQNALSDGVHTIVEFGGGIGRSDEPAAKRPNLASITQKAVKDSRPYGRYLPAINVPTLRRSAQLGKGVDGKWFYLLVPTVEDQIAADAMNSVKLVEELNLSPVVAVICEPSEKNLQTLGAVDSAINEPQACLWIVAFGQTGIILTQYETDIEETLVGLRKRLEKAA